VVSNVLNKGNGNALTVKLEGAFDDCNQGNYLVAVNKLGAFINQVEAFRGKKLTVAQADELISDAQNIILIIHEIQRAAVNVSTSPLPVTLGLTDGFAILSYAGITNTGPTSITGDVGASPITGDSMTGFETVALVGTIYTVDAAGPTGYVTDAAMDKHFPRDFINPPARLKYRQAILRSMLKATRMLFGFFK